MKILIVHNRYQTNNIGGEDIVYENELKSLQKILGNENVFSYEVCNDDINKIGLIFNIWFCKKHYQNIKDMVKNNNIDIVHVHNFFPLLTPSVFKGAKDAGATVVHTLHSYRIWCIGGILYRDKFGICEHCVKKKSLKGVFSKCFRKSFLQSLLAQLSFWYYRIFRLFENIDYFFVLTDFQKQKVKEFGIKKEKIILKPNSLNVDFSTKNEKKNYIYVGRLEESKGICKLLDIWIRLDEKFILTIVGSGEEEIILKKKYGRKNIIFKGKCTREETLYCISKAKYLIQASLLYETFGLTIIEAMGHGVPVIGLDIGTRKDFIKDNINGFLCKESELENTIKKSFYSKDYEYLSENAIKTAKFYENNYIISKQIEIYKNILGQNESVNHNSSL